MFRADGPSRSKSPRAERGGRRHRRALALGGGAAVLILAAGGAIGFHRAGPPIEGWVLTVAPRGSVAGGSPAEPRRLLALAARGDKEPRLLTANFFEAAGPDPSFAADHLLFAGRLKEGDPREIWEIELRSGTSRVVTPGQGEPADPIYLPDGRILFSDRVPGEDGARALFACGSDGTGMERLTFGGQADRRPGLLADGRIRFERLPAGSSSGEAIPLTMHPDGTGVSRWEDAAAQRTALQEGPGLADYRVVDRIAIAPRVSPPVLTSVVKLAAAEWKSGTLLCLDVYASRSVEVSRLPRGSVARVRVLAGTPRAGGTGRLAEAPVHPDGSFLVEVPADTPLRLELLDSGGARLAGLDRPIWVRPNENRGCVGCHEEPGRAPENRQPLAVTHPPESLFRALTRAGGGDEF